MMGTAERQVEIQIEIQMMTVHENGVSRHDLYDAGRLYWKFAIRQDPFVLAGETATTGLMAGIEHL